MIYITQHVADFVNRDKMFWTWSRFYHGLFLARLSVSCFLVAFVEFQCGRMFGGRTGCRLYRRTRGRRHGAASCPALTGASTPAVGPRFSAQSSVARSSRVTDGGARVSEATALRWPVDRRRRNIDTESNWRYVQPTTTITRHLASLPIYRLYVPQCIIAYSGRRR